MKKGKRGRNWTVEERTILFEMSRHGCTLAEINNALSDWQQKNGKPPRAVPASSYEMLINRYIPAACGEDDFRQMISSPPRWVDL